jgi:hypothetical protein
MIDRGIWIAAGAMIKLHGEDATVHAGIRADALQQQGNEEGYALRKRVVAAINERVSMEPDGNPH